MPLTPQEFYHLRFNQQRRDLILAIVNQIPDSECAGFSNLNVTLPKTVYIHSINRDSTWNKRARNV